MSLRASNTINTGLGWIVTVLFWVSLLIAAASYAVAVLSPKLLGYFELRDRHYANQVKLVQLEQQVQYLGSVGAALRNDPEFHRELARVDLDATRPGEERIEVDPTLSLHSSPIKNPTEAAQHPAPTGSRLLGSSPFAQIAHSRRTQQTLLLTAAAITIFAFTFLRVPGAADE
jgi:amino acid transporter